MTLEAPSAESKRIDYNSFVSKARVDIQNGKTSLAEDGVAQKYVKGHLKDFRYDAERGKWFFWDNGCWRIDTTGRAFEACRTLCRSLSEEPGVSARKAEKMRSYSFVSAVERFARTAKEMVVTSDMWNPDDMIIGTPGGIIDIAAGSVRPAQQDDMITRQTAVAPSGSAECPEWQAFLHQVTNGDQGLIRFLKAWCGYTLTGLTREHALLFIYGPGGNGKSVFLNTIAGIMGDYCETASIDTFTASRFEKHSTDIASLAGARMVSTSETEEGQAWAEAKIKSMTGGDKLKARFMRQDNFEFQPKFKLVIVGNHRPVLHNVDDAAKRRFNIVPFIYRPEKPDKGLEGRLREEWPGILRWMMEGAVDWHQNGLVRPQVVLDATAEYFSEQDLTQQWIDQCCYTGPNESATQVDLFQSWSQFARDNGESVGSSKAFTQNLMRVNPMLRRTIHVQGQRGKRGFLGISVIKDEIPPPPQYRD